MSLLPTVLPQWAIRISVRAVAVSTGGNAARERLRCQPANRRDDNGKMSKGHGMVDAGSEAEHGFL